MREKIKDVLRELTPNFVLDYFRGKRHVALYEEWEKNGRQIPPPHISKQKVINEYRTKFGLDTFIETGTYLGDTIASQMNNFKLLISIELSPELYKRAVNRFRKCPNIKLYNGDSGEVLKKIVPGLNSACLFWLDGHYCGGITAKGSIDTPIEEELKTVFGSNFPHVVLIDDARSFTGEDGYPTIEGLRKWVTEKSEYSFAVENDIIRLSKKA